MSLPLYKILEIHDPAKPSLWAKLFNAQIGERPVVVDLTPLGDKESAALELVEEFMLERKAMPFPYPFYVVSSKKSLRGSLQVFPSQERLPAYYKRKNRPLNMKENSLLAKVSLKQKNLENVNMEEARPLLESYGLKHKILGKKQSYFNYLEELLKGLEGERP